MAKCFPEPVLEQACNRITLERLTLWDGCCIHDSILAAHKQYIINESFEAEVLHRKAHPDQIYAEVAELSGVPSTSNYNHVSGKYTDASTAAHHRLSIPRYRRYSPRSTYASRGNLLSSHHVTKLELAEAACQAKIGKDWTTSSLRHYHAVIDSRFHDHKECPRFQADTLENRTALYDKVLRPSGLVVSQFSHAGQECIRLGSNIHNANENGFDYNLDRRQRRVGPKGGARNGQAGKGNSEHITSVVCIGITHAPVPGLFIYRGQTVQ